MPRRPPHEEARQNRILDYWTRPFAATRGIIRFLAKAGDVVREGQAIARIYNTFGRLQETMKARRNGIVPGHTDTSAAFPGMPVIAFGAP